MSKKTRSLFLKRIPLEIMLNLYRNPGEQYTAAKLSREMESVYAHVSKTVGKLESAGLVERKHVGRSKFISLTENGEALADSLDSTVRMFEVTVSEE